MAISEHQRKLLNSFWNKHQRLILAAFYSISIDPQQGGKIRKGVEKVIQSLSKKDYLQMVYRFLEWEFR